MKTFKEHSKQQDEQMRKVAQAASKLNVVKKAKDLLSKTKAAVVDKIKLKKLRDKLAQKKKDSFIGKAASKIAEGKMSWNHKIINDGTMGIGIFDPDKNAALKAAQALIIFLRKYKKVKIGTDDPDTGQANIEIQKYSEELSKLFFDDELLDSLEPDGSNADIRANDLVVKRLNALGVNIK